MEGGINGGDRAMPITPVKQAEINERRRLVRELWSLGLNCTVIAQMLEISVSDVNNDKKALNLTRTKHAQDSAESVIGVLDAIAQYVCSGKAEDDLLHALQRHPMIVELRQFLLGSVGAHIAVRRVVLTQTFPRHEATLLAAIWGDDSVSTDTSLSESQLHTDAHAAWKEFLAKDRSHEARAVSLATLRREIAQIVTEHFDERGVVRRPVDEEELSKQLNGLLMEIGETDMRVLRMRFGLDGKTHTLEQIARECGFNKARAGQIVDHGLKTLRRAFFSSETITVRGVELENERLKTMLERLQGEMSRLRSIHAPSMTPAVLTWLDRPITKLGLRSRLAWDLTRADIEFGGHLVQRSEETLRQVNGVGDQSIDEIKQLLKENGLTLGMDVSGWVPPV